MDLSISDKTTLALKLCIADPKTFGGIWVKTPAGPHLDTLRHLLAEHNVHTLSPNLSNSDLIGGIDPISSLSQAKLVRHQGLLERSGIFLSMMSERMPLDIAHILAQRMDKQNLGPIIVIDESDPDQAGPPSPLTDRLAFCVDAHALRAHEFTPSLDAIETSPFDLPKASDPHIQTLVVAALQLGIIDLRPVLMAHKAARYIAAFAGADHVDQSHLDMAATLVFAHRAVQIPEPEADSPEPPESTRDDQQQSAKDPSDNTPLPQDLIIEAIKASLPPDVLQHLSDMSRQRSASKGMGFGLRQKSYSKGRPKPPRLGRPNGQARIDILASLRAAAPWQKSRRAQRPEHTGILIYPSDLYIQRFENRSERVMIFAVDASGSAAMNRLGEAKGAVELLLAQSYAKRDYVALIGFREGRAEVLLQPTRSLVQTKKNLAALAAGGGTPLALGIEAALNLAMLARRNGKMPSLAFLTDGKGNIDLDGQPGRDKAMQDAQAVAQRARQLNIPTIVIDSGRRANPKLSELTAVMGGKYISLPRANAHGLSEIAQAHLN